MPLIQRTDKSVIEWSLIGMTIATRSVNEEAKTKLARFVRPQEFPNHSSHFLVLSPTTSHVSWMRRGGWNFVRPARGQRLSTASANLFPVASVRLLFRPSNSEYALPAVQWSLSIVKIMMFVNYDVCQGLGEESLHQEAPLAHSEPKRLPHKLFPHSIVVSHTIQYNNSSKI